MNVSATMTPEEAATRLDKVEDQLIAMLATQPLDIMLAALATTLGAVILASDNPGVAQRKALEIVRGVISGDLLDEGGMDRPG